MKFPDKFSITHMGSGNIYHLEARGGKWQMLGLSPIWSYTQAEIEDYLKREFWVILEENEVKECNGVDGDGKPFHFTKDDLKTGMRVTCRNGQRFIVLQDAGIFAQDVSQKDYGYNVIETYDEDLSCDSHMMWDIMEVHNFPTNHSEVLNLSERSKEALIWKRVEKSETQIQIEKLEETIKQAQEQINKIKENI